MAGRHRNPLVPPPAEEPLASPDHPEKACTQALCWLLDELLDAEDDLMELVARPGALVGWRERLRKFCLRLGEGVQRE